MRHCKTCKEYKTLDLFPKNKTYKSGYASQCKACRKVYNKEYYIANKNQVQQKNQEWYIANKDRKKQYDKEWRAKNAERIKRLCKEYRIANNQFTREICKKWRAANGAKMLVHGSNRRARKRSAYYEKYDRQAIFSRDKFICHLCGKRTKPKVNNNHPDFAVLDHVVPLALGGTDTPWNVKTACRDCNGKKKANLIGQPSLFEVPFLKAGLQ